MNKIIPQILGLLAVLAFLLSYQQKNRNSIIIWNVISRVLYILQYFLLGAFSGAILDILGAFSSVLAERKHTAFIKKHTVAIMILINSIIVIVGVVLLLQTKT